MELLKEILIDILSKEKCKVAFNFSNASLQKAIDLKCLRHLKTDKRNCPKRKFGRF